MRQSADDPAHKRLRPAIRYTDSALVKSRCGGRRARPEGGTASSASAKVPHGRLAPRRSRTPTKEGIKRRRACTDSRWSDLALHSDTKRSQIKMPKSASAEVEAATPGQVSGCAYVEEVVLIPAINGRPVINRADMAARGVPRTTVDGWYRDRARTGHPEKAGRIGRTDYWYEDEWTAWHEAHLRSKIEALTRVDHGGDPDDLVDATEAARMLRYSSRDVIHANRRLGYFPEPDAYGTTSKGRRAPLWKRSTVWATADSRKGMGGGHKPGTPGPPAKPHPYAGDERLDHVLSVLRSGEQPSAATLAAEWGTSRRTAERIIRTAKTLLQT
jgi:hypothetical protein